MGTSDQYGRKTPTTGNDMYGYVLAWRWQTARQRGDVAARWPAETRAPRYTHGLPGSMLFPQFTGRIRRPCWALNCGTRAMGRVRSGIFPWHAEARPAGHRRG